MMPHNEKSLEAFELSRFFGVLILFYSFAFLNILKCGLRKNHARLDEHFNRRKNFISKQRADRERKMVIGGNILKSN
jgi:hypothetical protein